MPRRYNGNGPLIGEIWPNASQWLAGDQMDAVMNYRFRKNITGFVRNAEWHDDNNNGSNDIPGLTPSQFDNAIRAVRDDYPPQATAAMLNLLDSHDVNRALYVMTESGRHRPGAGEAAPGTGGAVPVHLRRRAHGVLRR